VFYISIYLNINKLYSHW